MKTLNDSKEVLKLSDPIRVKTARELKFSKFVETACVIPVGTEVDVHFSETNPGRMYFEYNGSLRVVSTVNAHKNFAGGKFKKQPGLKTLERYSWDGIAKTVTGCKTEPDGYGPDGSPSWLLVVGVI